ncbi:MAG: type II toxin-antitoxin system VapC family toxin [Thiolinea sp.]
MIEQLKDKRVYFDTNPFIYFVEGHEVFGDAVKPVFELLDSGQITACTSQLTLTELLIKPYRDNLPEVIAAYESLLLDSGFFSVFGLNERTFLIAARLGGETRLRTPDALHLTVALENECDYFITNDKRIRSCQGLEVIQVADLITS